jgi:hypothetical protein
VKKRLLAGVAATAFAVPGLSATAVAHPGVDAYPSDPVQACVHDATHILLENPRYAAFRWVINLGLWNATLERGCRRTLGL